MNTSHGCDTLFLPKDGTRTAPNPMTCESCTYWRQAGRDKTGELWNGQDNWAGNCFIEPTRATRYRLDPVCRLVTPKDDLPREWAIINWALKQTPDK